MYAKFISETQININIPKNAEINGFVYGNIQNNPEILAQLGFFEVVEGTIPEYDPETQHLEPRYVQGENQIIRNQIVVENQPDVPSIKTYKKSFIFRWMYNHDCWEQFETMKNSQSMLRGYWENCIEFDDNDPNWPAMLQGVKLGLGLTDEQVQDLLNSSLKTDF